MLLRYYSILLQYCSVLQGTTPVLLCTTKCYSTSTLYYKYYPSTTLDSGLQSTTPVLLCTTKNTLYYKEYSVLQSTTPVLQSTTAVLLQYYSVTTLSPSKYYKVLLRTTNPPHHSSTTLYHKVLHRAILQSITAYERVLHDLSLALRGATRHQKLRLPGKMACLILVTHEEMSLTMLGATSVTLQPHQNTTPATQNDSHAACFIIVAYEASFTMRGATGVTLQPHQNSAPATQNDLHAWSSPHMKRHLQCAEQQVSPSNLAKIVRLPRKMTCMLDPHHTWNVIYNARSNRCHPPTSPK